ncbi:MULTISPECIES: SoxR reducing system RseC family protein [Alteromonas]|uniref:Positive regulator of sigma(E), RseC/MucC family protein n=1 Tax=Alteromonas macleodii TaxID=28108 RepID=A0A6T9Y4C8_ALTMA|nr:MULTISPECIES: SoxR reducing system RseC family protein [Alteromonas]MCZ8529645.1 SoxR reducing system RseC family protein [Alteromonas sp. PRIM-21]CAB9494683.1 Positive regulator of sigma(E), RseC/MucC family protein [Alteromonas macleodii]
MIKETATVVAVDGDTVTVEAAIKSTCNACQAQSDCGTGVISRAIAPKTQQLTLRTPMPVQVGQQVTVGIPEAGILSASAFLYLLPLIAFIGAYSVFISLLSSTGFSHELWALGPSALVTFITYKLIAYKLHRVERTKYQPVLLGQQGLN